jgi:hypothetical protein
LSHNLKYPSISLAIDSACGINAGPVVIKLAGSKSKNPGDIWVLDSKAYPDATTYGRITRNGGFLPYYKVPVNDAGKLEFWEQVKALIASLMADPVNTVIENAALTGYCCFCMHKLSDGRSTKHGYGPVCAKQYELPWDANSRVELKDAELAGV